MKTLLPCPACPEQSGETPLEFPQNVKNPAKKGLMGFVKALLKRHPAKLIKPHI
jgi:hypothetical protein